MLTQLNLKKYVEIPEEAAKLDTCLTLIGAMNVDSQTVK